jgi:hypothetical protein
MEGADKREWREGFSLVSLVSLSLPRLSLSVCVRASEGRRSPASCGNHQPSPTSSELPVTAAARSNPNRLCFVSPASDRRKIFKKRYGAPWNRGEESNIGSIPCGGLSVGFGVMSTQNLKPQIYDLGVSDFSWWGVRTRVCVCGGVTVSNKTKILFLGVLSLLFRLNGCWKSTVRGGSGV